MRKSMVLDSLLQGNDTRDGWVYLVKIKTPNAEGFNLYF